MAEFPPDEPVRDRFVPLEDVPLAKLKQQPGYAEYLNPTPVEVILPPSRTGRTVDKYLEEAEQALNAPIESQITEYDPVEHERLKRERAKEYAAKMMKETERVAAEKHAQQKMIMEPIQREAHDGHAQQNPIADMEGAPTALGMEAFNMNDGTWEILEQPEILGVGNALDNNPIADLFVENQLSGLAPDAANRERFAMRRAQFERLQNINRITREYNQRIKEAGRVGGAPAPVEKQLLSPQQANFSMFGGLYGAPEREAVAVTEKKEPKSSKRKAPKEKVVKILEPKRTRGRKKTISTIAEKAAVMIGKAARKKKGKSPSKKKSKSPSKKKKSPGRPRKPVVLLVEKIQKVKKAIEKKKKKGKKKSTKSKKKPRKSSRKRSKK